MWNSVFFEYSSAWIKWFAEGTDTQWWHDDQTRNDHTNLGNICLVFLFTLFLSADARVLCSTLNFRTSWGLHRWSDQHTLVSQRTCQRGVSIVRTISQHSNYIKNASQLYIINSTRSICHHTTTGEWSWIPDHWRAGGVQQLLIRLDAIYMNHLIRVGWLRTIVTTMYAYAVKNRLNV